MKKYPRYFEGLPVREGRGDILVQPTREDLRLAKRYDPANCAYAICLKRMLQTNRVFVYASIAYVETLDESGNPIMERYVIGNHAHAYIRAFDAGHEVAPGGFVLHKPSKGKTLEHKRVQSRDYARRHPQRVREYYRKSQAKLKAPKARELTGSFRDGKGKVHFVGLAGILETKATESI
jgi:hypothetical protein